MRNSFAELAMPLDLWVFGRERSGNAGICPESVGIRGVLYIFNHVQIIKMVVFISGAGSMCCLFKSVFFCGNFVEHDNCT